MSVILRHQAKDEPLQVPKLYRMVTGLTDQVHLAAKDHWERLERTLKLALWEDVPAPTAPPAVWSGAVRWGKKLNKAWIALEKAQGVAI